MTRVKDPAALRRLLEGIVDVETRRLLEADDMRMAQRTQAERDKQGAVAKHIKNTVPSKNRKEEEFEEDDDDLDDLFGDEESDKDDGGDKKKAKKKSGDDSDDTDDSSRDPEEGDPQKKRGLPKHMHTELPEASDITVDMVKDRLNVIRSGQSFKDEKVAIEMNHYFESLSDPERLALLSFLTGIAQVVTAGIEGEEAPDPGDPGVDVKISATDGDDDNEQSDDEEDRPKKKPKKQKGAEDTAPPIQVGKRAATEALRRKIRSLL